jgi:hypothetical protein
MRKLCLVVLLSSFALNATAQDQQLKEALAALKGQVQLLSDRLDLVETDIKTLKERPVASSGGALDQSNMKDEALLEWATSSIVKIYTYDYSMIDQTLPQLKNLFTAPGYDSFLKAFDESGNKKFIQDKKLNVTATLNGAATIIKQGPNTLYTWNVDVPLTVNYQSTLEKFKQNIVVTLEIVRVNDADAIKGIAINSVNARVVQDAPKTPPKPNGKP